jgi:hypothetical protein
MAYPLIDRDLGVHSLAVRALTRPDLLPALAIGEWDLLIRQARRSDLLGRLHARLEMHGLLHDVPPQARRHLDAARRVADKHARVVQWEIRQIRAALSATNVPVILLKGAAYVAAGLPPATGRIFSDIDLMVPKAALGLVEKRLLMNGWIADKLDSYDQRYYRRWMHELPPMRHRRRGTVVDVHHSILPETSRYRLEARLLREAAIPVWRDEGLRMLAPADMVLHSATHLFCDGEFDHALRDLADIDDLLRHFGDDPAFWTDLAARARQLGLSRPLYYALSQGRRWLGTPVPSALEGLLESGRPGPLAGFLMDALLERAMLPNHPSCDRTFSGLARGLLYVRGHYLRMPLRLLLPHLLRKAVRRQEQH